MFSRFSSVINRIFFLLTVALFMACSTEQVQEHPVVDRFEKLPSDIAKRGPETDIHPPVLHDSGFYDPEPLAGYVNSAGAEDSPFVTIAGDELYFFFTPDVRIPPEKQLLDSVTGVWRSKLMNGAWQQAERVWLQKPGMLALDGAVAIQGDEMWFASAREGYTGVNMFTSRKQGDIWVDWTYCGDRLMKELQIGEVHLHGNDLYFHSGRTGGKGGLDIWVTTRNGQDWSSPVNIDMINTIADEGYPYISSDGLELWFTRTFNGTPAIFRSRKIGNDFGIPELIISRFAGEPTLDAEGNLLFVHHFFENDQMIEADIYIARRKK